MTVMRKILNGVAVGAVLLSGILLAGCEELIDLIGGNAAPVISSVTASPSTVKAGGTVQLVAHATDADSDSLEYTWVPPNPPSGIFSSLTGRSIEWTAPDSAGDVTITVNVGDGKFITSDSVSIRVEAVYKEPPGNFRGTGGDREVRLSWENPLSTQFAKVVVRRSGSDFPGHAADGDPVYDGRKEVYTDAGLVNDARYYYAIFAEYRDGGYSDRETLSATPRSGLLPPAMPAGLRVAETSAESIKLVWNAVPQADRYELRRDGNEVYSGSDTSFADTGLSGNTEYIYHVRASNAAGTSDWSVDVRGRTDVLHPDTPIGLRVTETTTGSISLDWNDVPGADRYELWRDGSEIYSGSGTSYTNTGLAGDTEHSYKVRAMNDAGVSDWSADVKGRTELALPASPSDLRFEVIGTNSISLSWKAVPSAVSYELWRDGSEVYSGTGTSYTDIGLADDTEFSYKIRARNAVGTSAWSPVLTGRTALAVPDVPAGLQVTDKSTDSLVLSWEAVTGAAAYELYRDGSKVYEGDETSYADTGLPSDTGFSYKVRARNAAGISEWSNQVSGRTNRALPAVPSGLRITGKTADSISLEWDAVSGADSYELYRNGEGVVYSGSRTSHADTGLNSNTYYVFKLRSKNTAGISSWTSLVSDKTDLGIPLPPSGLRVNNKTASSIVLSWDTVGEAELYRLFRDGTKVYEGGDVAFTDSSGLSSGTGYSYTVRSHNSAGWSEASAPVTGWTIVAVPTLQVTETTTSSIKLSWNAVTGAIKYGLYRNGSRIYYNTGTSHTDTGLYENTMYSYRIRAYGEHDNSSELSDTPVNANTDLSLPNTPSGLRSAKTDINYITLTWNYVPGATSYEIRRDSYNIFSTSTTSYTDTGLRDDRRYDYEVRAINSAGNSAWSNEIEIRTNPFGQLEVYMQVLVDGRLNSRKFYPSGSQGGYETEDVTFSSTNLHFVFTFSQPVDPYEFEDIVQWSFFQPGEDFWYENIRRDNYNAYKYNSDERRVILRYGTNKNPRDIGVADVKMFFDIDEDFKSKDGRYAIGNKFDGIIGDVITGD